MAAPLRVFGSAKIIAACTLLSRVTGLARDVVLNAHFGQNWIQDAFNYGFQIPNLFRRLFGEGALSAVFVPTFTEVLERDGPRTAWALLARITALMSLVLTVVTLLLELAIFVVWQAAPASEMRGLMLGLTAVMLPFMITICLLALFSSILNCLGHFAMPALAPIVLNIANIAGVLVVGPLLGAELQRQVYGVAASVVAGGILQLVIVVPMLKRQGVSFGVLAVVPQADIRRMWRSFMPILLGQGLLLLNVYLDAQVCTFLTRGPDQPATFELFGRTIAYPLQAGALSAVNNAARLYQFPLGVLAISLATAAFPELSRLAARGDTEAMRGVLGGSLRMAVFEGLPAGLLMIVLAEPIVALLFQYNRFGPDETVRAAAVLRWYGLGMWAFCAQHIVVRGFYALKDTLTPMWIGCSLILLNQALNLALIWHPAVREGAFGIATSGTATIYVVVGLVLLRRRMGGRVGGRAFVSSAARSLAAAVSAAAAGYFVARWSAGLFPGGASRLLERALGVLLPMAAAGAVYFGAAIALRMDEPGWLIGRRKPAI